MKWQRKGGGESFHGATTRVARARVVILSIHSAASRIGARPGACGAVGWVAFAWTDRHGTDRPTAEGFRTTGTCSVLGPFFLLSCVYSVAAQLFFKDSDEADGDG